MCKDELSVNMFKKNGRRSDGLQSQCIECQKEYRKTHYEKNKQKYIEKASVWRDDFKQWWTEYKLQFKCPCGEDHPSCIEFHHTNDDKEFNIADLSNQGCKRRLLQELSKCTPLCSNCHKKLHWEQRQKRLCKSLKK